MIHHYWRSEARRRRRDASTTAIISEDDSDDVLASMFFSSQEDVIAKALGALDTVQLDVLLLVAGPGLTYEEVSEALGVPLGTVRSRLSRARTHLRELLGESRQYLEGEAFSPEQPPIVVEGAQ